jgi:hypothetical protein
MHTGLRFPYFKEHPMKAQPAEMERPPGTIFHLIFILSMLAAVALIIFNAIHTPWGPFYFYSEAHKSYGQQASVVLFTCLSIAIPQLKSAATTRYFNEHALLTRIEKKVLLSHPRLAMLLVILALMAFFATVIREKDAAIFMMALLAIFVAAEHLGGLHEQRQLLAEYRRDLKSLANASGLEHGQKVIYAAYRNSEDEVVRAVVRFFDIDREWFDARGDLKAYLANENPETFYNSLQGAKGVLFVADLPPPVSKKAVAPVQLGERELAKQFNNLLGLAWQWFILQEISALRPRSSPCMFEIRIASTSNWIHLADEHVYQLIEGRVSRENKVRDLTNDISATDPLYASLLDWARREIESTAQRGCSGEEFLCTTIYKFLHNEVKELAWLKRTPLEELLKNLGMNEWIARKTDYIDGLVTSDSDTIMLCRQIFERFLKTATDASRGTLSFSPRLAGECTEEWASPEADWICPILYLEREIV